MLSTRLQTPNYKQFLPHESNPPFPPLVKGGAGGFGHWNLKVEIFLEFGIWSLGFLFLIFSILFNLGCQRSKAAITVAGSTSVEPFAELLAEEYMSQQPQSHIYVQGG